MESTQDVLCDLLAYLREWENTGSEDKDADRDAVRAVAEAAKKLEGRASV